MSYASSDRTRREAENAAWLEAFMDSEIGIQSSSPIQGYMRSSPPTEPRVALEDERPDSSPALIQVPSPRRLESPGVTQHPTSELSLADEERQVREVEIPEAMARPAVRPTRSLTIPLVSEPARDDPEDPVQTMGQKVMLMGLESGHIWGLAMTIYRMAQHFTGGSHTEAWDRLIDDFEENAKFKTFVLLCSQPEYVLKSLIRNSMMYDAHDPLEPTDLEAWILSEMEEGPYAGIYLQMWTQGDEPHENREAESIAAGNNIDTGKFLTADQIASFIRKWGIYADPDHPQNTSLVRKVERVSNRDNYRSRGWSELRQKLDELYVANIPQQRKNLPHVRTMTEIGQSYQIPKRLKDHREWRNNNSTIGLSGSLFGVKNCIAPALEWSMKLNQLVLFHVWEADLDLLSLAEVVGTVISSSFMEEGGCNGATPGRAVGRNIENVRNSPNWGNSKEKLCKRECLSLNYTIADNYLQSRRAFLGDLDACKDLIDRRDRADSQLLGLYKEADEARKRLDDARATRQELLH